MIGAVSMDNLRDLMNIRIYKISNARIRESRRVTKGVDESIL